MIEHDQIVQIIPVPVHHHRRSAPLGKQTLPFRLHPAPVQDGLGFTPFHYHWLGASKLGRASRADVAIPHDLAEDRIDYQIRQPIVIPISHRLRGVAPLAFARALNGAVRAGHDAKRLAAGFQQLQRGPPWPFNFWAAEIFDERNVAGGVAADDVLITVSIPIKPHRRRQRAELHLVGFLLKINRRQKLRQSITHLAGMFDQRHAAVFIAHNEVDVAIAIPIHRARQNHLQLHGQRFTLMRELAAGGIFRRLARAGVFKIREAVHKLAAQQIEIAVPIEVRKVRRWPTVHIHRLAGRLHLGRRGVLRRGGRTLVEHQIEVTVQRAVGPFALCVVSIVPAVIIPNAHGSQQVERAIAVVIHVLPLVRTNLPMPFHAIDRIHTRLLLQIGRHFLAGNQKAWFAVHPTNLNVAH